MRNNVSKPLDRAYAGRVFPERNMRSHLVIIDGIFRKDPLKVLRVERDQMIVHSCRTDPIKRSAYPFCQRQNAPLEGINHFRVRHAAQGLHGNCLHGGERVLRAVVQFYQTHRRKITLDQRAPSRHDNALCHVAFTGGSKAPPFSQQILFR